MVVLDRFFFSFGGQEKWSLVALDRWLSCTVTIVCELAWADSALVLLDDWSSYRGGYISRFDCTISSRTGKNATSKIPNSTLHLDDWTRYFRHRTQLNSLKIKWIQKLLNPTNPFWKNLMLYQLKLILNDNQGLDLFT